ncbi:MULTISPECIES: DUF58 domain-containing protein [Rubrivivax]|nr:MULTISPECIES: DUF58 domain-containing protein [Rubrivivax]MCC9598220.1 DUF58 domain-containing protein [Rubrivivax sp. JA1055]MCC9645524.1 DUF58 domain-containing protein [Rubrivivax sp. JA1029]
MIAAAREAFERWLERRMPASDTWTLTQRNLYIVPTRAGLAFAATLLAMLLASINYQLNLGYVLTFLLAGAGLVSMHQTHGTLRGLTLHLKAPRPGFAADAATVEIVLTNPGRRPRHGIALGWRRQGGVAWCDVDAGAQETVQLAFVPPRRGWHALPLVVVETVFPLGLFRAWSVWRPAARVLAWPRPETPAPAVPAAAAQPGEAAAPAAQPAGQEFDGVRHYRRGDGLRQIVWKKVAQTGELVSRDGRGEGRREVWLDWADTGGDTERRLSRLAAWVQACEQAGRPWGLRLPGRELAPGGGDTQRRAALDLLAGWPG